MKRYGLTALIILSVIAGCLVDDDDDGNDPTTFTVSGRIVDTSNFGIDRVTVALTGETTDGTTVTRRVFTNSMGSFAVESVRNGTYTATPWKSNFGFYPENRDVTINGASRTLEIFTGYITTGGGSSAEGYSVFGKVENTYGVGIAGITVGISGEDIVKTDITDDNGNYGFGGILSGSYRVSPGGGKYSFNPPYANVFVRNYSVQVETFTAMPPEPDGGHDDTFDGPGTHEYFPLKAYASRTMRLEETDYDTGRTYDTTVTYSVIGTSVVYGREYWHVVSDDDASQYYRVSGDTLYTFSALALFDDGGGGSELENRFEDEAPYLLFDATAGDEWIILDWSTSQYGAFFAWKWTGQYQGTETVTTPYGTFAACRKYQVIFDAYGVGGGSSTRETTQTFIWLAPDVGIVKSIETKTNDGRTVSERTEEIVGWSG